MCWTLRPRSRTSVVSPFSHSSFAAQPPEMPEPMTIASNEVSAIRRVSSTLGIRDAHRAHRRFRYSPPSQRSANANRVTCSSHSLHDEHARQLLLGEKRVRSWIGGE